jgi:hypothetical protein
MCLLNVPTLIRSALSMRACAVWTGTYADSWPSYVARDAAYTPDMAKYAANATSTCMSCWCVQPICACGKR